MLKVCIHKNKDTVVQVCIHKNKDTVVLVTHAEKGNEDHMLFWQCVTAFSGHGFDIHDTPDNTSYYNTPWH